MTENVEEVKTVEELIDISDLQDPDECDSSNPEKMAFSPDVERAILASGLRYDTFGKLIADLVPPKSFTDDAHKAIAEILTKSLNDYKQLPSEALINNEFMERQKKAEKPEERAEFFRWRAELKAICSYYPEGDFPKGYLEEKIKAFAEHAISKEGVAKWLKTINDGTPDISPLRESLLRIDKMHSAAGRRAHFCTELEALPPATWQIASHIVEGGFSVVYGKYNTGKTFYCLDMALSVATGLPFLGKYPVIQGPVAYVAGESPNGIRKRIWAWLAERNLTFADCKDFALIPYQFDLLKQSEVAALTDLAKEKFGRMPSLFVLDTLTKMFGSGDYNAPKDMATFVNNLVAMQEAARSENQQAGLLVIHHVGKDTSKGPLGSVNLPGACDTQVELRGDIKTGVDVLFDKQRDADKDLCYKVVGKFIAEIPDSVDPEHGGTLVITPSSESVETAEEKAYRSKFYTVDKVLANMSETDYQSKAEIYNAVKEACERTNAVNQSVGKPTIPIIGVNKVSLITAWLEENGFVETDDNKNPKHRKYKSSGKRLQSAEYPNAADLP